MASRVQDAPGPKGTLNPMTSMVSKPSDKLFFWDSLHLTNYINASGANKSKLPGYHYYQKLERFYQLHFQQGELYMEFIKDDCLKNGDHEKCSFCKDNPWKAAKITRAPRPKPMVDSQDFLPLNDTPVYEDEVGGNLTIFSQGLSLKNCLVLMTFLLKVRKRLMSFANNLPLTGTLLLISFIIWSI